MELLRKSMTDFCIANGIQVIPQAERQYNRYKVYRCDFAKGVDYPAFYKLYDENEMEILNNQWQYICITVLDVGTHFALCLEAFGD